LIEPVLFVGFQLNMLNGLSSIEAVIYSEKVVNVKNGLPLI